MSVSSYRLQLKVGLLNLSSIEVDVRRGDEVVVRPVLRYGTVVHSTVVCGPSRRSVAAPLRALPPWTVLSGHLVSVSDVTAT